MVRKFMDKIKEGVSVQEVEDFARKYTAEVFTVLAIIVASISSMYDYFTGPKMAILFLALSTVVGIFFTAPVDRGLKQFYSFQAKQEKMTQLVIGLLKIIVALFIPFILFAGLGLLAGSSFHYYMRRSEIIMENKPPRRHHSTGDEHD